MTGPSAGSCPVKPMFGSKVSWSMIVWRAYSRAASVAHLAGSPKNIGPTILSDSCWPIDCTGWSATSTVAVAPGARSPATATDRRARRPA